MNVDTNNIISKPTDNQNSDSADFSKAAIGATHENQGTSASRKQSARWLEASNAKGSFRPSISSIGFFITPTILKRLGIEVPTLK
jgi:hypothetical protein